MAVDHQGREGLREELVDAERVLDYFLGLPPYEDGDALENAETMRYREMAIEDVRERIKEIKEEMGEEKGARGAREGD